jgi:hypothetical protein
VEYSPTGVPPHLQRGPDTMSPHLRQNPIERGITVSKCVDEATRKLDVEHQDRRTRAVFDFHVIARSPRVAHVQLDSQLAVRL